MYRQFNPNAQASKSPYRTLIDNSESSSSMGPVTQSSYNKFNNGSGNGLNISPIKSSQPKFGVAEKNQQSMQGPSGMMQNAHKRLREYQGSQGKTSVSKALFQSEAHSPSKHQPKTASAFSQNLRF